MPLIDTHGRTINYLRLSVTDRCNLRCRYCMPPEGVEQVTHDDLLSYEQLLQISQAAIEIGVEKIRVTGGEPLVRKGIVSFLEKLGQLPGLQRLVLTTNGLLLGEMAADLRNAGIESLNISLDSLCQDTFSRITRGGSVADVLRGIGAAEKAGFPYVKINVVVMRGINDNEIADFAALTIDRPYRIRFIEYMPTLQSSDWQATTVPGTELIEKLSQHYDMETVAREKHAGPSVNYRIKGALGTVGIITPVSCHFCSDCNRIRVTSSGMAKSCLFSNEMIDLKPYLGVKDRTGLCNALRDVVIAKPDQHQLLNRDISQQAIAMSQVGG
jgi:GTP 3',8-cyclase